MRENLNWAFIGAGGIAKEMAEAFERSGRKVYAVWNRTVERAEDF